MVVKYTCTGNQGNYIYNNELNYHQFRRAPDLTILKHDDEIGAATVATSSEEPDNDSDKNSQGTVVGTVENLIKIEGKYKDSEGKFMDSCLNLTILKNLVNFYQICTLC